MISHSPNLSACQYLQATRKFVNASVCQAVGHESGYTGFCGLGLRAISLVEMRSIHLVVKSSIASRERSLRPGSWLRTRCCHEMEGKPLDSSRLTSDGLNGPVVSLEAHYQTSPAILLCKVSCEPSDENVVTTSEHPKRLDSIVSLWLMFHDIPD
jgi:hypothetical protein